MGSKNIFRSNLFKVKVLFLTRVWGDALQVFDAAEAEEVLIASKQKKSSKHKLTCLPT